MRHIKINCRIVGFVQFLMHERKRLAIWFTAGPTTLYDEL